jgi:hypothetical protein
VHKFNILLSTIHRTPPPPKKKKKEKKPISILEVIKPNIQEGKERKKIKKKEKKKSLKSNIYDTQTYIRCKSSYWYPIDSPKINNALVEPNILYIQIFF